MKIFALAALTVTLMMGTMGSASAREVAFCGGGFDIQKVSGDKAVCAKSEQVWVKAGPRHCIAFLGLVGHRVPNEEASDGGDICTGDGAGAALRGPALACELDHSYGVGARTHNIRGGPDECQKQETRTVYGNIQTRNE